jgi:DNA-directed RNA polymerase subunit alpha
MDFKSLIMPRSLHCDKSTLTDTYGRFHAEPFERGYGVTIGNSLRRILLSSVQGAAPTAVRIEGVRHQFSSVDGVKEDISDILLNLKSLIFNLVNGTFESQIHLDARGPGVVTGKDFELNQNIEILNPDQPVATLSKGARLQMDLEVRQGRGYEPAEPIATDYDTIGVIPIDAVYSPIRNVRYAVEAARVGQRTDYDRLIMAEDAILYAARVLRDHLTLFISIEEEAVVTPQVEEEVPEITEQQLLTERLDKSIEELELSVRSYNCLEAAGIKTIRDLVQKTEAEMLKYRNFGRKSLTEIKNILKNMDLRFNMEIDPESGLPMKSDQA